MHRLSKAFLVVLIGVCCIVDAVPAKAAFTDTTDNSAAARSPVVRPRTSLADRIPNVTSRWFPKSGRTEISPELGMSFNDPFYKHMVLGASFRQHFTEWLVVGISGDYNIGFTSEPAVTGGGVERNVKHNTLVYSGRGEIFWAPFYGKLGLLGKAALHFDTYVGAGVGIVGFRDSGPTVAGSFVVGQHYFVNRWLAIKVELRDQLFQMVRHPQIDKTHALENTLTATMGVSFFLPVPASPRTASTQKSMP